MSILKNINTLEELNDVAFQPFIQERTDLLKFDTRLAFLVSNNLFPLIRSAIKNEVSISECYNFTEEDLISPNTLNSLSAYQDKVLFPFPRKDFYNTFLSNIIPDLADSIYENMKLTGRILPIGGGSHKGYILTPKEYTEIPTFNTFNIDPKATIDTINTSIDSLNQYINNASFYEHQIAHRDEIIKKLLIEIEQIKSQVMSAYQTTWR